MNLLRASIVLNCASTLSSTAVTEWHEVIFVTTGKWRQRFAAPMRLCAVAHEIFAKAVTHAVSHVT